MRKSFLTFCWNCGFLWLDRNSHPGAENFIEIVKLWVLSVLGIISGYEKVVSTSAEYVTGAPKPDKIAKESFCFDGGGIWEYLRSDSRMTNHNKQLSSPFSTGGGGYNFETRVQAHFVALMLSGGFAPALPPWPIKRIKLQGKYVGYDTDDAIVFVERPDGKKERKLLCQIKHSISITKAKTNKVFRDVIQAAWNDFNNTKVFRIGIDLIALITGPLSATDINDVRWILEQARNSDSAEDFLTRINQTKFSSDQKKEKLIAFQTHLKNANNGTDISDEKLWQFMKSFHLLGYDLDIKAGVTLSLVQSLISRYSPENANSLWTQIIDEVQLANQNAGAITVDSVSEQIRSAFKKPSVEKIPEDLGIKPSAPAITNWSNMKLAIANLLGGWDENA